MSEKDISKIQINDSLYHLMDNDAREQIVELSGKLVDLEDYTAFEVFAHDYNIPVGDNEELSGYVTTEIVSSMIESFKLWITETYSNSDIVID